MFLDITFVTVAFVRVVYAYVSWAR